MYQSNLLRSVAFSSSLVFLAHSGAASAVDCTSVYDEFCRRPSPCQKISAVDFVIGYKSNISSNELSMGAPLDDFDFTSGSLGTTEDVNVNNAVAPVNILSGDYKRLRFIPDSDEGLDVMFSVTVPPLAPAKVRVRTPSNLDMRNRSFIEVTSPDEETRKGLYISPNVKMSDCTLVNARRDSLNYKFMGKDMFVGPEDVESTAVKEFESLYSSPVRLLCRLTLVDTDDGSGHSSDGDAR